MIVDAFDRQTDRQTDRQFSWGGAAVAAFFICNLVTAYFYYNPAISIENKTLSTDYKRKASSYWTQAREGYANIEFDCGGFNNNKVPDTIDILCMGSSHTEAVQLEQKANYVSRLYDHLNVTTYNIGCSGHTFLHCYNNFSNAVNEFKPQRFVVFETKDIPDNLADFQKVEEGTFIRTTGKKWFDGNPILSELRKIAILRLLRVQGLTVLDNNKVRAEQKQKQGIDDAVYFQVYSKCLKNMTQVLDDQKQTKLIIFYHPHLKILTDGSVVAQADERLLNIFKKACASNKVIFLDMTERFIKEYNEKHILPYGFLNTAVGAGHLNENGHRMIAEELGKIIFAGSEVKEK